MAIKQKTETTVVTTTYICDMLFIEILKEEVYKTYWNHCISKEAVRRLPKDITENPEILKYTLYGSGQENEKFQPEWLHKGIWLLEVPTVDYGFVSKLTNNNNPGNNYNNKQYANDDHPSRFKKIQDAEEWINSRCEQFEK